MDGLYICISFVKTKHMSSPVVQSSELVTPKWLSYSTNMDARRSLNHHNHKVVYVALCLTLKNTPRYAMLFSPKQYAAYICISHKMIYCALIQILLCLFIVVVYVIIFWQCAT